MDIDATAAGRWLGLGVLDVDGEKIGKVKDIYLDDDTGKPEWLAVSTGLFGTKVTFVPIVSVQQRDGDDLTVPYTRGQVKDAPRCEADGHLSPEEESTLYSHYGLTYAGDTSRADESGDLLARRSSTGGMTEDEPAQPRLRRWTDERLDAAGGDASHS